MIPFTYERAASAAEAEDVVAEYSIEYGDLDEKYQESTFGALHRGRRLRRCRGDRPRDL
jgi:hypothetical protein